MCAYNTTFVAGAAFGDTKPTLDNGVDKLALTDYKWECDDPEDEAKSLMQWLTRDAYEFEVKNTVGFKTDDGEFVEAPNHNLIVNATLGEVLNDGDVSNQYRPIPNNWIVSEAVNAIKNMGLGDQMTAISRQHPAGAFVDMYFNHDCAHYEIEGVADTISSGLTVEWRHDGRSTVRVSPFIRFGNCRNTMRNLTDEDGEVIEFKLRHRGSIDDDDYEDEIRTELFEGVTEMLFRLGTLKNLVIDPIKESRDTPVDLDDYDFSDLDTDAHPLTELYRGLGLSKRVAEAATVRAAYRADYLANVTPAKGSNANDRQRLLDRIPENMGLTALDVVNGFTWAIKYVSNAKLTNGTYNDCQRTAYDLLEAPTERLTEAYTDRVSELDTVDDTDEMDAEETAARIEALSAD